MFYNAHLHWYLTIKQIYKDGSTCNKSAAEERQTNGNKERGTEGGRELEGGWTCCSHRDEYLERERLVRNLCHVQMEHYPTKQTGSACMCINTARRLLSLGRLPGDKYTQWPPLPLIPVTSPPAHPVPPSTGGLSAAQLAADLSV